MLCQLAALALALGCTPSGDPVEVAEACLVSVSPAGGRVELSEEHCRDPGLSGAVLNVPAGAFETSTQLTVVRRTSLALPGEREAGPAVRLLPSGLKLKKPIQIELPYEPSAIALSDDLVAAVDAARVQLPNPLRYAVASVKRRPFTLTLDLLADVQALLVPSPGLPISGSDDIKYMDFLFVIDNSPSMENKQMALVQAFPGFIDKVLGCQADIHIGIISTDVGTVPTGSPPWPPPTNDTCNTERGRSWGFQGLTCLETGATPADKCAMACPKMVRPSTANFIHIYDDPMTGMRTSNVSAGGTVESNVKAAFGCMAYLGATGCHIEQPLESARRAVLEDDGTFFRSKDPRVMPYEVMTVLVFVTDEDDCSIAKRQWANDGDTDPGSPDRYARFGGNFRCFGMSTRCAADDTALSKPGLKSSCAPYDYSGYLTSIDQLGNDLTGYDAATKLYTRQLILAGLWSGMPVDVDGTRFGGAYGPSPTPSPVELIYPYAMSSDSTWLDLKANTCAGLAKAESRPQHRLSHMAEFRGVLASYQGDICEQTEYGKVLDLLAAALQSAKIKRCQ